jgi:kynurenine formamidase
MSTTNPNDEYDRWIDELAKSAPFGPGDRLGTANYIDAAARQRAGDAVRTGVCVPLARPVSEGANATDGSEDALASVVVDVMHHEMDSFNGRSFSFGGEPVNTGGDTTHIQPHGQNATHLDALNHIGRGGSWYSGFAVDDPDGHSVMHLARHGLFTRGVLVDIPAVRGTDWVAADAPVTGDDIDAALAATGTTFEPGDALLLYMGRDRFEAAGGYLNAMSGNAMPGAGASAARWIAEHQVSILCWDFLDAILPAEPDMQVHLLIWAIGLLLVDNAHLGDAAAQVRKSGRAMGAFAATPAAVPRATGALLQPLFVQ